LRLPIKGLNRNSSGNDPEEFRLSLTEHLEELRTRIVRSAAIFLACWVLAWFVEVPFRTFLSERARISIEANLPKGYTYVESIFDAADAFMIPFKFSAMVAVVIAAPLIILQLWAFIAPGLKPKEQAPFKKLAPISVLLFGIGAGFAWFVLPSAYAWFASFMDRFKDTVLNQSAGTMAFFSLKMMLAFGLGFQLPLVVYVLGALNLLSATTLLKYWRHSVLAVFFLAGAITPSNDIGTMLMMAIPLTVLFAISVYAVKYVQRKRGDEEFLWSDSAEEDEDAKNPALYPVNPESSAIDESAESTASEEVPVQVGEAHSETEHYTNLYKPTVSDDYEQAP
jgi:sec-independent protein translocase protein TatC